MSPLFPRGPRKDTDLPALVAVQEADSGKLLTPMVHCRLLNVSPEGCCFSPEQVMVDSIHLFFATLNNTDAHLLLQLLPPDGEEPFSEIVLSPVWMNSLHIGNRIEFRIGTRFHIPHPEILEWIKKNF